MKLKSLLALAAVALCGTANAQITAGDYFIQNVKSGAFLNGANDWGTKASVTKHGQKMTIAASGDGYTIDSHIANSTTAHFVAAGDNTYADGAAAAHTFELQSDGSYAIKDSNGKYLVQNDGTKVNFAGESVTDAAKWNLISMDDVAELMATASVTAPVDATFYIGDANFSRNNQYKSLWIVSSDCTNKNLGGGNNVNFCAESWHSSFTISQTINVPNGVYGVTAQGFVRSDGGDITEAVFFANGVTQAFPEKTGAENSMTDASNSFSNGAYTIDKMIVAVTDGTLEVGVKNTSNSLWCIWDNFELTYYGDVSIAEVELAEYVNAYKEAMDAAKALLDADMSEDAKAALNEAITNNTVDFNNTTEKALTEATNNLKEATKVAQAAADKKAWENKRDELIAEGKGTDLTELLVNAAFEMGNLTGWTSVDGGNIANNTNYNTSKFVERWLNGVALGNGSLTHDAINLPAGLYTIKVDAQNLEQYNGNAAGKGLFLRAAGEEVEIGARGIYSMLVKLDEAQDVTIAIVQDNCTGNWVCYDNIQLIYEGEDLPALTAVTGNMNAEVASAQTNALAAYNANKTVANYNAAAAAISAAEDSKAKYDAVSAKVSTLDDAGKAAFAETATGAKYAANTYVDEDITADYITAVKAQGVGADMTAAAHTSWDGQSGTVAAQYCPDMPGAPERYQAGAFTGDVMTMTITGLKEGTYKVVLRGGASYTSGRGFDGGTGQNRAYLFANDALYSLEVYDRTVITEGTVETAELTCGVNEDGTLKMGIQNKTMGANWFVVKLESITYMSESLPTTDVELAVSEAQYATFMAPFDAELPAGVKAYTVDGIGEDNELVMTETTIKANTPVVLFSESPVSKTLTGVSEAEAATYTEGLLTGVYAPVEITAGYVLQNGEKGVKFYAVSADDAITVPANKAYLTTTSEAKALGFPAVATAINALTTGGVEAIYSTNGVKQSKLQKGMNIIMVNGQAQKVLVK